MSEESSKYMNINKKRFFLSCLLVVLVMIGVFSANYRHYRSMISAAGGYPYQVGLTNTMIAPCVVSGYVCIATGGKADATAACNTKGTGVCASYSYVSGQQSGGMGDGALLQKSVIQKIGLVAGASYIGGGTSAVLMDNGVSASIGGTAYGVARATDRLVDFFIAGGKE